MRSNWRARSSLRKRVDSRASRTRSRRRPTPQCWIGSSRSPAGNRPLSKHPRSEEHTSELQSLRHLVCRLLLEKKKKKVRLGETKRKTNKEAFDGHATYSPS